MDIFNAKLRVVNDGAEIADDSSGVLEVRDVHFEYFTKPDVAVLKGVSFATNVQTKRLVAICGHSGCGKSSVVSLIERFYDPTQGSILLNGKDIRQLDNEWYHQQVGIV